MSRGVLLVSGMELGGKRLNTCKIDEAFGLDPQGGTFPLDCSPGDPEFATLRATSPAVQKAGERLYRSLVAHEPLRTFFAQTLAATADEPAPVYIRVDTPDAEELPWEILWESERQFRVLDPQGRWPIARLASAAKRAEPLARIIGSELRMAVVLAAARESGANEWARIAGAIGSHEVPLNLLALVSEDEARTAVEADAAAWQQSESPARKASVEFTGDSATMLAKLRTHLPNVIHFFCHGVSDVRPQLELETRADRKRKCDRGSILLDSSLLEGLARMRSLWLVVLNCCQGAKTAPQLHSLARNLVAAGVPAVVAMRESVEVGDANLFAEHFYDGLFARLKSIFSVRNDMALPHPPMTFREVYWALAVHQAQRELNNAHGSQPDSSAQWTYPVLYVHRDQLELHPRELQPETLSAQRRLELVTELDVLRQVRTTLGFGAGFEPPDRGAELDARIRELECTLSAN